jgi:hypothetical protein
MYTASLGPSLTRHDAIPQADDLAGRVGLFQLQLDFDAQLVEAADPVS